MKANEVPLNSFLSQPKTQFIIPVYQRNYDWHEDQCRQMFYDIIEVGNNPEGTHFIGSIVFIHEGVYTSAEVKQLVVIDGQQRLTTFSLLYLALYKFAMDNEIQEKGEEIHDTYITNKYVKEEGNKLKLKQSENNANAFKFLLSNNNPNTFSEFSKVINNFNYFYQNISKQNFNIILNGLNRLLFVEISLERGKDDPQRIFESLNSTGLELSQADLIRNYILMGLAPDDQVKVFENYWDVIEKNAKDYHKEESRVSDFIRDYLTFKNKKIPNRNSVYEEFKTRHMNRDDRFYSHTLEDLRNFSYYYNKLINPIREEDLEIRQQLSYINRLEIDVSFPFLLPVMNDYSKGIIDKQTLIMILQLVQSFTWRRFIVGLTPSGLNNIFMNLYSEVSKDNYLQSIQKAVIKKKSGYRMPTNSEIESILAEKDVYNIKPKNKLYFFELLENYNNREYVNIDVSDITIEHIFPQNPDIRWREQLDESEYEEMSNKYINTIGNLTLSGNNGSLGNKIFTEKKYLNKDEKNQGYMFSRLWLNQFLREIDIWNIENLRERLSLITERFFKIWSYPDINIEDDIDLDEDYTINNAPDPRYKKLDYFIFRDEKIETEEVAKMYYHVVKILFEENTAAFNHYFLKQTVGLSSDPSLLRNAYPIGSGIYIEANIDNNTKFSRLKSLLTYFNLEDELLINYSNRDVDDKDNETANREYWEEQASSESLYILDSCLDIMKSIQPDVQYNYTFSYIGLKMGMNRFKQTNNLVIAIPKSKFVRAEIWFDNTDSWVETLRDKGIHVISTSKNKVLRIRIDRDTITYHKELIHELFKLAVDHSFSVNSTTI
ncbi:MAG: DUF262 domain-containing protein [Bacteroidetes bacterium]|nr:DUF262 domain-containing protein [Bacteroidota bacterium]